MTHIDASIRRRSLTLIGIFLLAAPRPALAQVGADPQALFEQQSVAAEDLTSEGDWDEARRAWLSVLREHAGADYVRPLLPEIRVALRRAAFWSEHRRPDPKELISGRLLSYSRSTGKVRIQYSADQLEDFEGIANYVLHPLRFRDNYTVEVEAPPAALTSLMVLVGMDAGDGYLVQAGDLVKGDVIFTPHQLLRMVDGENELLESADPKERKSRSKPDKVTLKISVSESKVSVSYDRRSLFSVKKDSDVLGRFGLTRPAQFDKLTITGKAEIAWLEDLIDASVQDERQAFDVAYDDPPELGAWGEAVVPVRSSRDLNELTSELRLPDRFTPEQALIVRELLDWIGAGRHDDVAARLEQLAAGQVPEASLAFLRLMNCVGSRRYARALQHADALADLTAPGPELRRVLVALQMNIERYEEAIEDLDALLREEPNDVALHAELSTAQLLAGRLDDARQSIDAALALAPADEELLELRVQIAKSSQGPSWKRSFNEQGERLHVHSDISKRVTLLISREAEQSFAYFIERLGERGLRDGPVQLYLFSGESSYRSYLEGVEDESHENSAGVFSRRLKQILVWNQPDEEQLRHVVRHEVMHAYVDQTLGVTPLWFGEGLAEYFAAARQEGDAWVEGSPAPQHLYNLQRYGLEKITLEQLLYMQSENFMRNAEYTYAMSWAFVDFLLNSTPEYRALFDAMHETLTGDVDAITATHQVFDGVDIEGLEREYWDHVRAKL